MKRLKALFWRISDRISVRLKIMGIVLGLVALMGVGVTLQMRTQLSLTMHDELLRRGVSVARDVASRSTDSLLTNNEFALHQLVMDTRRDNEDIRYVFILDPKGQLVVHTFSDGFPRDLLGANTLPTGARDHIEPLQTEEGLVWDVAVPIFAGRAGTVRLGLTPLHLQQALQAATGRMLWAMALVSLIGVLAAAGLTAVLTRPILDLVEVTRAVGRGDLSRRVTSQSQEEIGQLAAAFNEMTVALERSRSKVTAFSRRLLLQNEERQRLLARALSFQEEERKRISRELHDETGQALTSLMVGLKLADEARSPEEAHQKLAELRGQAAETLENVRNLAFQLRPSALDDLGLVAAVRRYVKQYDSQYGIPVDCEINGFEGQRLPPEMETAFYRIIQEALTNVARHAQATNVSVVMEHRGTSVVAIVEDNGRGFEIGKELGSRLRERQLGLVGMRERAALVYGRIQVESTPGVGTTIYIEVPLPGDDGEVGMT
ncbi:MAG: HAMP domain-containing sensor histidine kinase [Symbiobacteriia bacterium]